MMAAVVAFLMFAAAEPTAAQTFAVFVALLVIFASIGLWFQIVVRALDRRPPLPYEPRLHVPWSGGDVLLLIFAWLMSDLIAVRATDEGEALVRGEVSISLLSAITAAHFIWALLAIAYLRVRCGTRPADFGFSVGHIGRDAMAGFAAFLVALVPVYGLQLLVTQFMTPMEHPVAKFVKEHGDGATLALAAISAVIVAPLAEELLFRVILQGWLERVVTRARRYSTITARAVTILPILASSAAFASLHQGSDRIALFVLAIILGYLYRQTHRIWPSLILHVCFNSLGVIGVWLGLE